jgi:DNA polymerase II large subunit
MQKYFDELVDNTNKAMKVAQEARKKGYDPQDFVEISLAKNTAERVVGIISVIAPQIKGTGIVKRIIDLEKKYGITDWRVAMTIALEIAQLKYCKFKDEREAIEVGIKTGFAYITQGRVSSPLEGFTKLEIVERNDKQGKYFRMKYAGPIRSAGATMGAVSVILGSYLAKQLGYAFYDPTEKEIQWCFAHLEDFNTFGSNLQYFPSKRETVFMAKNLPVQLMGEPSERYEIGNALLKDLPRIDTNNLSSGFCLILAECLCLKAPKLWKQLSRWGKDFGLDYWNFLEEFINIQKEVKAQGQKAVDTDEKVKPDFTYIKDIVAGRPVLGYPMKPGAFRLRYGRARVSGYSAQCIHPATMIALDSFIALGTQLKVERPGKATALMSTDYIDGPIVKLKDGSVLFLESTEKAKEVNKEVEEVLFLGDILVNYGDFLDRAHVLVPPGYTQEFWILEFEKKVIELFGNLDYDKLGELLDIKSNALKKLFANPIKTKISARAAYKISKILNIPLHPRYNFYWSTITKEDLINLLMLIQKLKIKEDEKGNIESIIFTLVDKTFMPGKRTLELLGIPHLFVNNEYVVLDKDYGLALLESLNISSSDDYVFLLKELAKEDDEIFSVLSFVNKLSSAFLRDKAGLFIGSRMGRPEKAKMRKMRGSPHGLFPVGAEGGKLRSFQSAMQSRKVTAEFHIFWCDHCKKETIFSVCEICGKKTRTYDLYSDDNIKKKFHADFKPVKKLSIPINKYIDLFRKKAGLRVIPDLIKGVRGTFNNHYQEHLMKALLRSKHKIYVNKDGTTRYDCSELTLTHFKPKEVHTPIEKLIELGYTHDVYNKPLVDDNQILELKAQDIVLPACPDSPEDTSTEVLFKIANYVDDLLDKLYGLKPFYNFKKPTDLVGHLIIGLAPHTSAGTVGRIIGYSKTQGFLAHALFHAAMRRDCDGDESGFILLMDALLNFSVKYLPTSRGSTQDAPLVLSSLLDPSEVDDMAFNVDRVFKYPLSFYMAALEYKYPWDSHLQTIGDVLETEQQFEGMGFTHDSTNINEGVLCSAYKILPSMDEKLNGQLTLARKIRAVDQSKVAQLVIERHFIRDTKGNLRKFSMQEFRCGSCNTKYRRPPLTSKTNGKDVYCPVCKKGKIIFTISEGSVIKYLGKSLKLAEEYDVPFYLKQSLELLQLRVEDVFGKEKEKQTGLGQFF